MFLSVFDMFKVGVGPSSSHTMGPMVAGSRFLDMLRGLPFAVHGLRASLHGSLAFTGKGHATDRATILGLAGFLPETYDATAAEAALAANRETLTLTPPGLPPLVFDPAKDLIFDFGPALPGHATDRATILGLAGFLPETYDATAAEAALAANRETLTLTPPGLPPLAFDPAKDLIFDFGPALPGHANGMVLMATDAQGDVIAQETYYSIGGGFVLTADEAAGVTDKSLRTPSSVPFPFQTAAEMLQMAAGSGKSIAEMKRANERRFRTDADIDAGLKRIWSVMNDCIERGMATEGILPGGLKVKRRAKGIRDALIAERGMNLTAPHVINDWMSTYAMAVNEENAAGGQVVTAPTNGAAGVVPAVIRYWLDHVPGASSARVGEFLLTAAAVGGLVKHNASISGAECGCQAEVGSAAAMAAAGLAAVLGGTVTQIENAAEIALEHHLGMTCDPVKGLVQVPCIERNGLGAIKAVSAASLALRGDGTHLVPLDAAIETMRQTGRDMHEKYKETSLGGLAVNVPNC